MRDWILNSALAPDLSQAVNYVKANVWEMESGVGLQQAELMIHNQLAFFGTHDIVDHIGGASREGMSRSKGVVDAIHRKFLTVLNRI